jgi:hypothetical protein
VNAIQHLCRLWATRQNPNHPLSEDERGNTQPATAADEVSRIAEVLIGTPLDPDEDGRPWR